MYYAFYTYKVIVVYNLCIYVIYYKTTIVIYKYSLFTCILL